MRPRLRESLTELVLGAIAFLVILATGAYIASSAAPAVASKPAPAKVIVHQHEPPEMHAIYVKPVLPAPALASPREVPKPVTVTRASRSVEAVRLCILHRESRGNYRAVSREDYHGMHAYGGYQFQDPTWFHVTHLPGHASDYPPAVQDAAFLKLYDNGRGRSNWFWKGHTQCW